MSTPEERKQRGRLATSRAMMGNQNARKKPAHAASAPGFTLSFEPDFIRSLDDITAFTLNGVTFRPGDAVWITHRETGSRLYGRLGTFYGVGRIRGIRVDTPMVGEFHFPFLKAEDHEIYAIELVDFAKEARERLTKVTETFREAYPGLLPGVAAAEHQRRMAEEA